MIQDPMLNNRTAPWPVRNMDNIGDNYAEGPRIRVRCTWPRGIYYNHQRRYENDVFELIPQWITITNKETGMPELDEHKKPKRKVFTAEEQFSSRTMELVDGDIPTNITTAQMALSQKQGELDESKTPMRSRKQ
jgi:hypothetical protein